LSCNGVAIPGDVSAPWPQDPILYIFLVWPAHLAKCFEKGCHFSLHYLLYSLQLWSDEDHSVKLRFYVMNFKGDWKYLVQLFNFRKNPSTEKAGPSFLGPGHGALHRFPWPGHICFMWYLILDLIYIYIYQLIGDI
jgi:hypothetical protein